VRIRGVHDISNVQKKILHNMNLREVNTAIFMKMDKKNLVKLKRIENYVTYGYQSHLIQIPQS
jgi:ribosomal protein L30/L7E